jgi:hypothetical protein
VTLFAVGLWAIWACDSRGARRRSTKRLKDASGPVYIHLVQRTAATRLMIAAKHSSLFS